MADTTDILTIDTCILDYASYWRTDSGSAMNKTAQFKKQRNSIQNVQIKQSGI